MENEGRGARKECNKSVKFVVYNINTKQKKIYCSQIKLIYLIYQSFSRFPFSRCSRIRNSHFQLRRSIFTAIRNRQLVNSGGSLLHQRRFLLFPSLSLLSILLEFLLSFLLRSFFFLQLFQTQFLLLALFHSQRQLLKRRNARCQLIETDSRYRISRIELELPRIRDSWKCFGTPLLIETHLIMRTNEIQRAMKHIHEFQKISIVQRFH